MREQLMNHNEFMLLVQSCITGELILTANELMGYASECSELSRLEEIERLNTYVDYALVKVRLATNRVVKIA